MPKSYFILIYIFIILLILSAGFLFKENTEELTKKSAEYLQMGDRTRSVEYARKAFRSDSQYDPAVHMAILHFRMKDRFAQAESFLNKSLDEGSISSNAYYENLGLIYLNKNQYEKARTYFMNISNSTKVNALLGMSMISYKMEDYETSLKYIDEISDYLGKPNDYIQKEIAQNTIESLMKLIKNETTIDEIEQDHKNGKMFILHYIRMLRY